MTTQPQQPTELSALLLIRIREVELPAYIAAGLIVRSVCENWTDARFRHERFRAKWTYFFERLGAEAGEGEIKMLSEGEDGEC